MRVAIYLSHHDLPFWHQPQQPTGLFDPKNLAGWTYHDDEKQKDLPAAKHFMMPVLNGLFGLQLPGVMAHVSMIFDSAERRVKCPHRVWVQITTDAQKLLDGEGLPIIVRNGEVQVEHLWGGDNGTRTPFDFPGIDTDNMETNTSKFWTDLFLAKLQDAKSRKIAEATEAIVKAGRTLQLYALIPS